MKGPTIMRMLATLAAVALVALGAVSAAGAAPNSATTTLDTAFPTTGTTINATFTVFGTTPVVPYEYALDNVCTMKTGNFKLGQRDAIVYWNQDAAGNPTVTMPIYLESVPTGATCRVSLIHNNTIVKGSTVQYTVG
jgi:hypothetical protein